MFNELEAFHVTIRFKPVIGFENNASLTGFRLKKENPSRCPPRSAPRSELMKQSLILSIDVCRGLGISPLRITQLAEFFSGRSWPNTCPGYIFTSMYMCFLALRHFFLFRPRVFPRALGSMAHREPARTRYTSLGSGRGPWHVLWGFKVARSLGEAFRARTRAIQAHANPHVHGAL